MVVQLFYELYCIVKQLRYYACSDWSKTYSLLQRLNDTDSHHSSVTRPTLKANRRQTLITAAKTGPCFLVICYSYDCLHFWM